MSFFQASTNINSDNRSDASNASRPSPSSRSSILPNNSATLVCVVCGDRARKLHYGALTCRGCKHFFKRVVRSNLRPVCHGTGDCPVDAQLWLECPACRFRMCIAKGMKCEEVGRVGERTYKATTSASGAISSTSTTQWTNHSETSSDSLSDDSEPAAPSSTAAPTLSEAINFVSFPDPMLDMNVLLSAEVRAGLNIPLNKHNNEPSFYVDLENCDVDPCVVVCHSVEQQFPKIIHWSRDIMNAAGISVSGQDQFYLFRSAWPELLLLTAAFHSLAVPDGVLLSNGCHLSRKKAQHCDIGPLLDRFLDEVVSRFRALQFDRIELIIMRAIVLFNPEAKFLENRYQVEAIRETLYTGLCAYCSNSRPNEVARFTKLLLRLPSLHMLSQKCMEHLLFSKFSTSAPFMQCFVRSLMHKTFNQPQGYDPDMMN